MKLTGLMAAGLAAGIATAAQADLVIPDLSYRTGPFAAGGIPFSDGYQDYFTLLNERDGGIGGEMVRLIECETAYNTEKGVECYEATKNEGALVYQPLSTGITYQIIPKATADGIPIHTMGYGRTSAADGSIFRNVFNYPVNYWDGASIAVKYLNEQAGGSLEGKKIALLYLNLAYGKEPIPTLQKLSEDYGYELMEIPVDAATMQDQKSQWLQIRRERPDYVLMWGWGAMNQAAIQEAANINFPMENFMGIWWSGGDHDVTPAGDGANGYKALSFSDYKDYPVIGEIQEHVVDAGKAAGDGSHVGSVIYNRGMLAAMFAAEAIKTAQEMHGVSDITPLQMRDGMEALEITNAKLADLGMEGISPEFSVSCEDHGGAGQAVVLQWDAGAGTWNTLTDYIASDASVIDPLIEADATAYAKENGIEPGCS